MNETPLVWTTKGNIPLERLQHMVDWEVTPEQIVFVESYALDGEIVKRSSHVKILVGTAGAGEANI